MCTEIFQEIQKEIDGNAVVLFMKGDPTFPQCGFSAAIAGLLTNLNIEFKGVNVLASEEIRQAIKEFSDWPTIPQLYIKGEFIGGCDIVRVMYHSGDFIKLFVDKDIQHNAA